MLEIHYNIIHNVQSVLSDENSLNSWLFPPPGFSGSYSLKTRVNELHVRLSEDSSSSAFKLVTNLI